MTDTTVLVAGAGPVGATLALELGSRGIDTTIVDPRGFAEPPTTVKCNHVSARSMEIYRRLGVADAIRAAGLPGDFPHDCSYRTTATGYELGRTRLPSRDERLAGVEGADSWWPAAEPAHRINQVFMEPVLVEHAAALESVRFVNGVEVTGLEQGDEHVVATLSDDTRIAAAFLVGCDGPRSLVRRLIGAEFVGQPQAALVQSTYIRAPRLLERMGAAWAVEAWNRRRGGVVFAIDGRETFLVHNPLAPHEPSFDAVDRDRAIRTILGVGDDFDYEVLSVEDWEGRRLVASRLRAGRVFLAGDAAHLWLPFAGYGMNAGIADVADLAWQLAAHLGGWAPAGILNAYERERQPVTEQVGRTATGFVEELMGLRSRIPAELEEPDAGATRAEFGVQVTALGTRQFAAGGFNFGYFYDDSPIIAYDEEPQPPFTMDEFTQSTVPGCRAPYALLEDGRPLWDGLGAGYTLLRLDETVDVTSLTAAAARRGMPFDVLDVAGSGSESYDRRLVLVRPDQHVAWRGDEAPEGPVSLVDLLSGA